MEKIKLTIMVALLATASQAQTTIWYGTSTGTLGTNNSFFGYFTGNAANGSSTDNSFFGTSSGRLTTSGTRNVAFGSSALYSNSTGSDNHAFGSQALYSNTSGFNNFAIGSYSLYFNTTGRDNVAIGLAALYYNTGSYNVAIGGAALNTNNSGTANTGVGYRALYNNTTAGENSSFGYQALYTNSTGSYNTGSGSNALYSNTTAHFNTAHGYYSLRSNTTGAGNTANGAHALRNNSTGGYNTAVGLEALYSNTASYNTAEGYLSMHENSTGGYNAAYGYSALFSNATGNYNTVAGSSAGPTASNLSNSTALGYSAVPTASNQVRIGNSSVTSIGGYANWSNVSDGRFKKEVKEDVLGLDFINRLRPVSYLLDRNELDAFLGVSDIVKEQLQSLRGEPTREIGFIAQDVESVVNTTKTTFQGVEKPQNEKDAYAISYATFVVPLVKAVQELSAKFEDQQKVVELQKLRIDSLSAKLGNEGLNKTGNTSVGKAILFQNNPNPFTIDTEIKMELPTTIRLAEIIIYNMEGTQLKSIRVNDRGTTETKILAGELRPGLYIYSLIADGEVVDLKRMVLRE